MTGYSSPIKSLIDKFSKLPGIGGRSAQRLAFHIIKMSVAEVEEFAKAIVDAKKQIKYCSVCCNYTDKDICPICLSEFRNKKSIMVVEEPKDMSAYEKTRQYKGVYHILHGSISPMNNITPSDIKIKELLSRISVSDPPDEIILATNATVEGEATAMYIAKLIKPLGIKVTRIANGVPIGSDLEYIDEITLFRALEGRLEM